MSTKDAKDQVAEDLMRQLLDRNLADVEDLPEYADFLPTGFYHLKINDIQFKNVEIQEKDKPQNQKTDAPVVQFVYEVVSALELEDQSIAEDKLPKPGLIFNESIFMHKEPDKAIAVIKAKYKDLALTLGIENVMELLTKIKGMEVGAIVKSKADKDKTKDKWYIQVNNVKAI